MERGLNENGHLVCKFAFKRLPDQPAIPVRAFDEDDDDQAGREEGDNDEDGNQGQASEDESS